MKFHNLRGQSRRKRTKKRDRLGAPSFLSHIEERSKGALTSSVSVSWQRSNTPKAPLCDRKLDLHLLQSTKMKRKVCTLHANGHDDFVNLFKGWSLYCFGSLGSPPSENVVSTRGVSSIPRYSEVVIACLILSFTASGHYSIDMQISRRCGCRARLRLNIGIKAIA